MPMTAFAKSPAPYADDDARWDAVCRRDRGADGAFVLSVRTTGVYCRPSCGARRPLRQNVRFHVDCAAAERAGFRPCKRCRPNETGERHTAAITAACREIAAAEDMPPLTELAHTAGLSPFHFHRVFRQVTGLTPRQYRAAERGKRLREELPRAQSVTAAIYDAGFNSSGRFYAASDAILGMTPSRFRAGGAGVKIRFAVGQCSLGAILVAASEKGICAIMLGDEAGALVRALEDRFPKAALEAGDSGFESWVAQVVGLVETPQIGLDLPLDLRGTAFQQRVWRALREIPPGTTATYTEIARRIGAPHAVRAVGTACGANPIAVAIPCHRVVRSDGSLAGYRWGIERKRALIARESGR
ncbi:MAG TPA: bifunctional DNA-binding transcriptional regulator/O6-methylguanine-DNA methyltransferase Ada [Stellaceae bacterium]|nr:bifunctional DNA-binding transcriptional regulator/O6-methylguanine-DNA methyltransferase Ada [Stellaceae bacterium]